MATLERIKAEYEEHLRANWLPDGTLKGNTKMFDSWKEAMESLADSPMTDLLNIPSPIWEGLNRCKQ